MADCNTCKRRYYCPFRGRIKGKCPYYIPDPYKLWAKQVLGGIHSS